MRYIKYPTLAWVTVGAVGEIKCDSQGKKTEG